MRCYQQGCRSIELLLTLQQDAQLLPHHLQVPPVTSGGIYGVHQGVDCGDQFGNAGLKAKSARTVSGEDLVELRVEPEGEAVIPVEAGSDALTVPIEAHQVKVVHVLVIDPHPGANTCD